MPASAPRIERHAGRDEAVIFARRSVPGSLALVAWMIGWSLVAPLVSHAWRLPGLWGALLWVLFKVVFGWLLALLALAWMWGGAERLAVVGGDLQVRHTIFGLPVTTRLYRGAEIRFLAPSDLPATSWFGDPVPPFVSSTRCGGLKFFYRERTVYAGHDLDGEAARHLAEWLRARLPSGAGEARPER